MHCSGHRQCYLFIFHLVLFTTLALAIWWVFGYMGGLSVASPSTLSHLINWHLLLMLLAFVWFFSNAVIMYRVYSCDLATQHKLHIALQTIALLCIFAAVICMEVWKIMNSELPVVLRNTEISSSHFYSFHSWCGAMTIIAFVAQYVVLVVPGLRAAYADLCIWLIVFTFVIATATLITGIEDVAWWRYDEGLLDYKHYSTESFVINIMTVLLLGVLFLVALAWFRAPYSATDRADYQDVGVTDNTHTTRPMKGEFI